MNDKCKYCDYLSKCSRKCEYNSVLCRINRSFPKTLDIPYKDLQQRIEKTLEFCNYLLQNNVIVIDGKKYYKHECDDVITNKLLEILKGDSNE